MINTYCDEILFLTQILTTNKKSVETFMVSISSLPHLIPAQGWRQKKETVVVLGGAHHNMGGMV